jgi:Xaa-Pro aminopeptidase
VHYALRREKLAHELSRRKLDALLVTHLPNIRYLCGFTGSAAALLISPEGASLFTDGRYTQQARAEAAGTRVVIQRASPLIAAADAARRHKLRRVGFEASHLTVAGRASLRRALGPKSLLRETTGMVETQRQVKDASEMTVIRQAVNLGASLLETALQVIRPGVAEAAVAAELEYAARLAGAEGMSFETIVAAGPRSALPHGRASAALIPTRGFVILDFGVILHGYCSDMTRTVHVGKASGAEREFYDAVRAAQQAAIAAVRAGVSCGRVDAAARNVLGHAGLARFFTHSTGHGVGLEIHEAPRLGRAQQEKLQTGMVVTIEPGVYVPAQSRPPWGGGRRVVGGVRIEDMVVVTEGGCDVLTPAPKDLLEL